MQNEFPEDTKVGILVGSDHCVAIERDLNRRRGISQTSKKTKWQIYLKVAVSGEGFAEKDLVILVGTKLNV